MEAARTSDSVLDDLSELERSTPDEVVRQRAHERVQIRVRVIAQPGNPSQRQAFKLLGTTGDVSAGGMQALFPLPLGVGDVHLISFDRGELDVPPVLARCVRCRMIHESAFEAGLSFFSPIDLTGFAHRPEGLLG